MLSEEILSKHCLMMMSYKEYALRSWNKHEQNKWVIGKILLNAAQ